jgi:hypothetical protein
MPLDICCNTPGLASVSMCQAMNPLDKRHRRLLLACFCIPIYTWNVYRSIVYISAPCQKALLRSPLLNPQRLRHMLPCRWGCRRAPQPLARTHRAERRFRISAPSSWGTSPTQIHDRRDCATKSRNAYQWVPVTTRKANGAGKRDYEWKERRGRGGAGEGDCVVRYRKLRVIRTMSDDEASQRRHTGHIPLCD